MLVSGELLESLLAGGLAVQGLKRVFGRESPQSASASTGVWASLPKPEKLSEKSDQVLCLPVGTHHDHHLGGDGAERQLCAESLRAAARLPCDRRGGRGTHRAVVALGRATSRSASPSATDWKLASFSHDARHPRQKKKPRRSPAIS